MPTIKVAAADVLGTLRAVVAERPEYVYEAPEDARVDDSLSCYYVHRSEDGTQVPGCLIGHVLNRLGVPLHVLRGYEGSDARRVVDRTVSFTGDPDEGLDVRMALQIAQSAQDGGDSWGESLAQALGE